MNLPEPMELLDLPDKGSLTLKVQSWEDGEATIKTGAVPEGKVVAITRLHTTKEYKPLYPFYYDVTSKTLRAQLAPQLPDIVKNQRTLVITKYGVAPQARFSVELR